MTKNDVRHTPGPWLVSSSLIVCDKDARIICSSVDSDIDVVGYIDFKERRANANLIASAPELLEALKKLAMVCKDKYQADIIDQAIAKAEGRG